MENSATKVAVYPHGETGMMAKIRDDVMLMEKEDKGITPGETLLSALGGCKGMVLQRIAEIRKVNIKDFHVEVYGKKDSSKAIGYRQITTHYFIDTDDLEGEKLEKFVEMVERNCFVMVTMAEPPEFVTKIN